MANFDERVVEKIERFRQRQSRKFSDFPQTEGVGVVLRAIARFLAVSVTIFIIWYEFPELSENPEFLWLSLNWGIYTAIIFWLDYRQTKMKTTGEKVDELVLKLDELITEIRRGKGGIDDGSRNNL